MRKLRNYIYIMVSVFLFSMVAPSFASAIDTSDAAPTKNERLADSEMFDQTENVLKSIEKIPNAVLDKGIEATAEWFEKETGLFVSIYYREGEGFLKFGEQDPNVIRTSNVAGCVTAVGIALVNNAFSFTKITKIKSALKALGGTTKAVKKIKKHYDEYRYGGFSRYKAMDKALHDASKGLNKDVKDALLDFFSLTGIVANCF
ncbi:MULTISPECIES: hypothetical protein [Bacillus]|uniref:hypothetical protein n=1 Tax=Bacillus TaxID=1386 RepID=UPI0005D3E270|nr:hypothetical protein [Bacillus altitudinis]KQL39147.1 hypothetical protein AN962_16650 [Bacillus sp. FJAT-21955]KJF45935.1 hypothetical protein BAIE_18220 [Bacillus altitudinis]MBU8654463.1 hypothetical protein [Bacillus altitudinis]MBU8779932.1 hypothetical protein [Bacillus altitudinis]NMF14985.1 hypothetical protein [Bacillus altitudinis]